MSDSQVNDEGKKEEGAGGARGAYLYVFMGEQETLGLHVTCGDMRVVML